MVTTSSRFRQSISAGLTLALPLTTVAACGWGSERDPVAAVAGSGKGAIVVWAHQGQSDEDAVLRNAVSSFNASQDEIRVSLKLIPEHVYTKTISATSTSDLPDVLEFDGPIMASFVYNKKLSPLYSNVSIRTLANVTDAVKEQGTINDRLYGLAMYDSGLGLYGNRELLDAANVSYPKKIGETWTAEEFTVALKKLGAMDGDGKSLDIQERNGLDSEWGTYGFSPIVWSAGGSLLGRGGTATGVLDRPSVVSAMKTFQSWNRYVDPNSDGKAFTQGRVALSWAGHWMYPSYSKAIDNNLVVLPLPDFGHGTKSGQGSWGWGIGAGSENGKAAGAFLDYLLNDANVSAMTAVNGAPPATISAVSSSDLYKPGGPLELFVNQLDQPCGARYFSSNCVAVTRPMTAGYPVVTSQFSKALKAIYEGADPGSELSDAASFIDQDFSSNDGYKIPYVP
ncbi:ABC transporter substrate-binding protein [Streptomyces sp. NPDC055709]